MHKTSFTLITTAMAASFLLPAMAASFVVTSYKASPETILRTPLQADSSDVNTFSTSSLLKARRMPLDDQLQNWTTMTTDSAGHLALLSNADNMRLQSFKTHLRAERFAKGSIRITTTSRASLSLNGSTLITKESSDSAASTEKAAVTLLPEKDYDLTVNILSLPDDKAADTGFSVEFVPDKDFEDVAINHSVSGERRFEIEDINLGERVTSTELSPDGKYIITRYSRMFDAKNTRRHATLSETSSGRIINATLNYSASWMPRGQRLYYTVKQGDSYDVITMPPTGNAETVLATGVPVNSFYIAPDESYLLYYDDVDGKKDTEVMRRVTAPDDRIPGNRNRRYLVKYDFNSHIAAPLTYGGSSTIVSDISPDSRKVLLMSPHETPDKYPFYDNMLIELDLATLKADTIVKGEGFLNEAVYSPDGRSLFLLGGPDVFNRIGMNAGGHEIPNNFDVQGYIMDLATRAVRAATRDFNPSIAGSPVWNPADNNIYFRANDGFNTPLYQLNPKNLKITKLPVEIATVGNFSIGNEQSQWLSYTGQTYDNIGEAFLLNLKSGKTRILDNPMASRLGNLTLGKIEPWVYTHKDGTKVDGIVCYPPDFDPAKKYPMIVYYYAGTTPSNATMHHPYTPHLFASRDYVVYIPNPSGTIGYGQEFSARHVNAWGKRTADEIIDGVKEFCRTHDFVNKKKIGCIGASYGGFMTQYLQTKTDIFAAAVSHAGISNVTSYWGEGYWGYSYNAVAAAQKYPWTDPDFFTRQGSLFNADKIHTPLLLLHGTDDTNVPIGESIQLFNALRVLGRDVEFITVEGQDHIIMDYEKRKLWQNTIMAWFAKYLQDDPRWWNSLYGK